MRLILIIGLVVSLLIIGCSTGSKIKLGYWVKEKPHRGTLDKNKFHKKPYWQCTENIQPYKNMKCDYVDRTGR